ncbi:uncharacterized protein LOC111320633 [Stylophora pistillata]|uniref:uncharacterized protein LOC111320633 n=1 Tax=Stylophora pistillata TaxID=50429 RepID=UPI000C04C2F3|nr:uncharacterized protein LOC111320633 [Stylophora pistillata]
MIAKERGMELILKAVFGMIFVLIMISHSQSSSANSKSRRLQLLIKDIIAPRIKNATKEMQTTYPFITSTNDLQETMMMLGVIVTKRCSSNLQLKDKLTISYLKLSNYISPLYMAYSYEEAHGHKYTVLASVLRETSFFLNSTVSTLRHELLIRGHSVPTGQVMLTEAQLNGYTRGYLQALVNKKWLNLTITDDVVRIYRNYVTYYTFHDVITEVYTCVFSV